MSDDAITRKTFEPFTPGTVKVEILTGLKFSDFQLAVTKRKKCCLIHEAGSTKSGVYGSARKTNVAFFSIVKK